MEPTRVEIHITVTVNDTPLPVLETVLREALAPYEWAGVGRDRTQDDIETKTLPAV